MNGSRRARSHLRADRAVMRKARRGQTGGLQPGSWKKRSEPSAHRVVNGKGVLSGAAAFEWPGLQRRLLEAEGVVFEEDGHVDLKKYGWRTVMEDALCFREQFERLGI